jgi:peptidoglycan/xylan/chitin deacetylase (PgdA/CDA1 family)
LRMLNKARKNRQPEGLHCLGCDNAIAPALRRLGSLQCLDCRHGNETIDAAVAEVAAAWCATRTTSAVCNAAEERAHGALWMFPWMLARGRRRHRRIAAFGTGMLLVALVLTLSPSSGVSGLVTSTLNPTEDAYVSESAGSTNFGTAPQLYAGGSPITRSYLKFDVPTLAGTVSKATLRLYATGTSPTGFEVRGAANNWSETRITYKSAPTPSSTVTGSSGALTTGAWAAFDVTSLVKGSGTVTFALTSTASPADVLGSRESPNQPQLVLDVNDTTAPTVTLTQPAKGATVTATPSFAGKAGSVAGDAATVTVKVYAGSSASGTPVQSLSASRQANNSYSMVASAPLAAGTYTARAEQQDAAGNTGFSSANTFTVALAAPAAPVNTSVPTISGTAEEDQVLTASPGSWTGTAPISYGYQWRRCDGGGAGCVDIFAATAASYTLVAADLGATIRVLVTGSNSVGSSSASSAQTAVVAAAPAAPVNTSVPTISGTAQEGQLLSASPGTWSGTAPISYAYQWRRCDSGGAGCTNVAGATTSTYTLVTADVGATIRVLVTGSNSVGSSSASSAQTAVVKGATTTIVSLTFNDGPTSQYTYARPALQAHNMKGTFYVVSGWVDNKAAGYMSSWQLDDLNRDGDEIGGMGTDHKDLTQAYYSNWTQDYAYKKQQVCGDHDRLAQLGYDPQSFAYPAAAYNYTFPDGSTVEGIVRSCGYLAGRTAGGLSTSGPAYAEPVPPKDAYALRTAALASSAITLTALQNAVTAAASHGGGWLPIAFNQLCHQGDANYSTCIASTNKPIDDATFSAFLDWLQKAGQPGGAPAGTAVQTVRQVMGAPPQPPLPPRQTVVSFTFDDGDASQVSASQILADRGMHGTFYISTQDHTATWAQIGQIADAGHEIGGHTQHHIDMTSTSYTYNQKVREVCDGRQDLIDQGYDPVSFAYPFGAYDAQAESIVKSCNFQTGRRAGGVTTAGPVYAEVQPPADAYALRTLFRSATTPLQAAELEDAVNATTTHGGGWLILVFHEVCAPNDATCLNSYKPIAVDQFTQFADWLKNTAPSTVRVRDVREVMAGQ